MEVKMNNKYELFLNIDSLTKSVYENGFNSKGYEIIYKDDNILFVKKVNVQYYNQQHEKIVIDVIVSMAKKYNPDGIVHIDLSDEVNSILDKIKDDENVRGFDNRITWPIRQAFTKAIASKKKQEASED